MKIIYPPLIEQAYNLLLQRGEKDITKQDLYKMMVKKQAIDENGNPTTKGFKMGLFEKISFNTANPIEKFKLENPAFMTIPNENFSVKDGRVLIDVQGLKMACNQVIYNPNSSPHQIKNARKILEQIKKYK
ncbi:hypothetical protein J2Z60_002144 [Lactobacillus colini]|uniref:Uncharacterized protein n=1 Tax=Lactobacillus colini TaxID=1819254 RepID=A0ABS4MGY2_9LACO|nr:hypothetical protein [Lactobacillus colini]MBP2058953.1 hypothetical protein [Lactobacillus colini]